jgi:hypothetical protein
VSNVGPSFGFVSFVDDTGCEGVVLGVGDAVA